MFAPFFIFHASTGTGKLAALSVDDTSCNASIYAAAQENIQIILSHPVFQGIDNLPALTINHDDASQCGQIPPFAKPQFDAAMTAVGKYTCGINFFHMDPVYAACPGTPIRQQSITQLAAHYFEKPTWFRGSLNIGISTGIDIIKAINNHGLQTYTPEEIRFAFLYAISRDVQADLAEDQLLIWRCFGKLMNIKVFRFHLLCFQKFKTIHNLRFRQACAPLGASRISICGFR